MSQDRALTLYCKGLRQVKDMWEPSQKSFKSLPTLTTHFKLSNTDQASLTSLIQYLNNSYGDILRRPPYTI
jgi:hypothetical protein